MASQSSQRDHRRQIGEHLTSPQFWTIVKLMSYCSGCCKSLYSEHRLLATIFFYIFVFMYCLIELYIPIQNYFQLHCFFLNNVSYWTAFYTSTFSMMQFSVFVQMTSFLLFSSFNKFNADMLFIFFFVVHRIVCVHTTIQTPDY